MSISKHISYKEATRSNTAARFGIRNVPNRQQYTNMQLVANHVFEPLRKHFGVPIYVSSFFRSSALNAKVGGAKTSSHTRGEAIDLDDVLGGVSNLEIFDWIKANLEFDQLIWEFGTDYNPAWVHVSWKLSGNRNQVLRAEKYTNWYGKRKTKYTEL